MTITIVVKTLADDFTNGTQRIGALVGFINLTVLLSIWQERLGITTLSLFGSSFLVYGVIILLVGHYDRIIREKIIKK